MTKPLSLPGSLVKVCTRALRCAAVGLCLIATQPAAAAGLSPVFDDQSNSEDARARLRVTSTFVVKLGSGSSPTTTVLGAPNGDGGTVLRLVDFERFIRELSEELDAAGPNVSVAATGE